MNKIPYATLTNNYLIKYDNGKSESYSGIALSKLSLKLGYKEDTLRNIFYGKISGNSRGIVSITKF